MSLCIAHVLSLLKGATGACAMIPWAEFVSAGAVDHWSAGVGGISSGAGEV